MTERDRINEAIRRDREEQAKRSSSAAGGSAAQPWIEQPTRAGWWWWERSDEPQYVEPLTNGRGEDLGLGVDMKGKGCTRCHDLPGWWSGPIERPKPRHENTPQIDELADSLRPKSRQTSNNLKT